MFSTTQFLPVPSNPSTEISLRITCRHYHLKGKVEELLKKMKISPSFSSQELSFINQWETELLCHFDNVENEEKQDAGSLALCLLIHDVIHPALLRDEASIVNQNELIVFEETVRELLSRMIPNEKSVDQYIEEVEELDQERILLDEKLKIVEKCFESQVQELYSSANIVNNDLLLLFESLKIKLLHLSKSRGHIAEETHQRIDSLTKKIEKISGILTEHANDICQQSNKFKKEQSHFRQLLVDTHNLIGKV
jgi:hypothetical protein